MVLVGVLDLGECLVGVLGGKLGLSLVVFLLVLLLVGSWLVLSVLV